MTNEVRIMDVNKWSWVSSISALTPEAQFPTTGSSSFNTGTIAGAAVGGAAVFALFAGLIAFFLIRRRKKKMLEEEKQKPSRIRMLPDENELSQVDSNTIYATTRGQSDSSTTQGQLSAFYNSQKPDASVLVTRIHKGEYRPVSLAMKPVKPDGG
ncbi:hypothetical protein BDC45DRAFT_145180 [Circinella umbellata]|nr:hypothetical protein BDC45DRAFT_145180 [Circinella umbellata]